MSKRSIQLQETLYCGIDVSAKNLTLAIQRVGQPIQQRSFPNSPNGHRALIVWLRKAKSPVRVSLEATGIYSLDLAFALAAAEEIEVAVLNPKVANRFAQTIRRSKTDAADAEVLAEYTHRMPFIAWIAPSFCSIRLRSIVRHVESLSLQSAQNQNRLHAAHGSTSTPGCVVQDLKRSVASLEQRIHKLRREAMIVIRQDELLHRRYELLVSIPGIAQVSAMQLLAELSTLPSDLTVREWVAHSGLDPAHEISGSSVRKASRISRAGNRHLRRALYMPALVASRCDPHAKAFFESLMARNKARLQALIAVARKLLHAIYAQLAELFSIPARIVELDDTQAMEWQLIELSVVVKRFLIVPWSCTSWISPRRADFPFIGVTISKGYNRMPDESRDNGRRLAPRVHRPVVAE